MAFLNERDLSLTYVDDQSPTLRNKYVGKWSKYFDGNTTKYYNGTYTLTSTPGDSFSFTFSGTKTRLYGALFNANVSQDGHFISYPIADYLVDGNPVGPQAPFLDGKWIAYFQTGDLQAGSHTVNLTVTTANQSNPFIIDFYTSTSTAGTHSSASSTSTSTGLQSTPPDHIDAILGGVVGGLTVIAILTIGLFYFYFLRRKSHGDQGYDFEKPDPVDVIFDNNPTEPFNHTINTTEPTNSDNLNSPANPPFWQSAVDPFPSQTSQASSTTQPSTRKATPVVRPSGNVRRPVQHEDSGIRFNTHEGQEPARSQSPSEVPPMYTEG